MGTLVADLKLVALSRQNSDTSEFHSEEDSTLLRKEPIDNYVPPVEPEVERQNKLSFPIPESNALLLPESLPTNDDLTTSIPPFSFLEPNDEETSNHREGKHTKRLENEELIMPMSTQKATLQRTDSVYMAEMAEPKGEKKSRNWMNFVLNKGCTVMGLSTEDDYTGRKKQAEYAFGTGVWALVRTANLEALARKLKSKPALARLRGPVGETMLHLCFLYNTPEHQTMAKYLMTEFPDLIYECYDGEDYFGENCLHVALIKQNKHMVEELLQRSGADDTRLLKAQATGRFFARGRPCYYGEFPLFFAACTSQKEMVDRLLDAGAQLDERDSNGNTVLHLLVIHSLPDMYSYMMDKWKAWRANSRIIKRAQPQFDLWHVYNNEKLTPFTLAAELNNKVMFEFILAKRVQLHWEYGPVKCVLYPLEELDIPLEFEQHTGSSQQHLYSTLNMLAPTDRPARVPSALEIIVQRAHVSLLMSPRVQEILDKKWERFAGRVFATRFILTLLFLSIFTATLVISQSPSSSPQLRRAGESLVLAVALYSGGLEVAEMASWGFGNYWRIPGSGFLENVLILGFACSITSIAVCRVLEADAAIERNLLAFASVLAWSYVLYFLLAFRLTGHFVVMIYKMLATDMLRFCMIFVTFLVGFSQAFFVLFSFEGAAGVLESLLLCFKAMLGEVDFDSKFSIIPTLFMVVYIIVVAILLFNLLIAMMGDTYTNVNEAADAQWYLERARIIFAIEKKMSTAARTQAQNTYWTTIDSIPEGAEAPMTKRYLQIEQVNQDHFTAAAALTVTG